MSGTIIRGDYTEQVEVLTPDETEEQKKQREEAAKKKDQSEG